MIERTHYTEIGLATAQIVNRVVHSSQAAYSIFTRTLRFGPPSVRNQGAIMRTFDLEKASHLSSLPSWLDVPSFMGEVMRLSSNAIWAEVLQRAEPGQVANLEQISGNSRAEMPSIISGANEPLYGFTPVLVSAAIFGQGLFKQNLIGGLVGNPWNPAIKAAAKHFKTPVRSMEELMSRMEELFPAENADSAPFSAFHLIENHDVFGKKGELTCLVINGTRYFFEAYGKALRERSDVDSYGNTFREGILSQSFKDQRRAELRERDEWERQRRGNR